MLRFSVTGTAEMSDITWVKTVLSFLASFKGLAALLFVIIKEVISNFTLLQQRHNVTIIMQHASCLKSVMSLVGTSTAFPLMSEIQVEKRFLFSVKALLT